MYRPDRYRKDDPSYIFDFIRSHPFASFITAGGSSGDLLATHIPVLVKGKPSEFFLYAHIANHNEQLAHLKDGKEGLFIFQDAHAYVSSSWYQEKNISTWDYSAVHVNFTIKLQSRQELIESLKNLVYRFEKNRKDPQYYEDLPDAMIQDHLQRITGFWAYPDRVQAVAKLHQDFKAEDIESVTRHLDNQKDPLSPVVSQNIRMENDK